MGNSDINGAAIRLRGRAAQLGVVVAVVLVAGALWAGRIDWTAGRHRNKEPLEWLAVGYKILAAGGLAVVARNLRSRSMSLLAALVAALLAGSYATGGRWFDRFARDLSRQIDPIVSVSAGTLKLTVLFLTLAVVAAWLVFAAYRAATDRERHVVLVLIGLIFVVGVFIGPVNAIASLGINAEWLFAEDFGQVVSLALLGGYVVGLVAATWPRPDEPA